MGQLRRLPHVWGRDGSLRAFLNVCRRRGAKGRKAAATIGSSHVRIVRLGMPITLPERSYKPQFARSKNAQHRSSGDRGDSFHHARRRVYCYKTHPIALMAFLTLASIFIAAAPARAESYPVCLAGGENNATQCEYANLETMPRYGIWGLRLLRYEPSVHLRRIRSL
jgi:hypothetical protein